MRHRFIQSFMLTAPTDGRRFSNFERLREDPAIPELFDLESVVSGDTVRRFFASIDPVLGAEWIARQVQPLWRALPARIILDWDSTVHRKYGHQEGAEVGYNLWVLFVRFIEAQKHTEAKRGRRWFLLIAARLVQSGRQKEVQVAIPGGWAEQ